MTKSLYSPIWLAIGLLFTAIGCQKGCSDAIYIDAPQKAPGRVFELDHPHLANENDYDDDRYAVGWWPKLARDESGKIHLIYCDAENADLKYANYDGSSWQLSTIVAKDAVGKYLAIAVDSHGYPHVTFYDQKNRYYNYGRQDHDGWHFERLAWGVELGAGASMLLDKDNLPHVIFYGSNGRLLHLHRKIPLNGPLGTAKEPNYQSANKDDWQEIIIGPYGGGFSAMTDLKTGPDGRLYASFVNSQLVKSGFYYGIYDGNSWQTTQVADRDAPGWSSSVVFDDYGPMVIYGSLLRERLYLRHIKSDQADLDRVYALRLGSLKALRDDAGRLLIAHQYLQPGSTGFGQMRLLVIDRDRSASYEIDSHRDSGQYLDMVLDRQGKPVIAYFDPVTRSLKIYME